MRVMGVNCTASDAYLVVVDDGVVVEDLPERLRLPRGIESGERLLEFVDEVRRTLAQTRPDLVALLLPEGRQPGASYQRIAPRVELETLLRLAAAQEGVPVDLLARTTVRSHLSLALSGSLDSHLGRAGPATGHYWNEGRGLAALAAMSQQEG